MKSVVKTFEVGADKRARPQTSRQPRPWPRSLATGYKEDVDEDDTDAARLAAIRDSDERTNKKLAEMEKKIDALLKASNAGN